MRFMNRFTLFVIAAAIVVLGFTFFSSGAKAQNDAWWIVRAEYGTRAQHTDVTDILKDLIGRGGVNGRVAVNNQTMGGDPAIGADKHLRIIARRSKYDSGNTIDEREFEFREGGFVDVAMFTVRRDRDEWNDRPPSDRGRDQRDQDDSSGLRIIRAYYGIQGRMVNVTDLLRSRVRDGGISFVVTNSAFGGDPAVGADKILIVVYRVQGTETATAVREGNTLTLP